MKRKPIYSTHIGAASILLIFLVLSLISFASLTLVNSRADYILSKKMLDRSLSYYQACHEASGFIAENEPSYRKIDWSDPNINVNSLNKSITLSEFQTLDVNIKPMYSEGPDTPTYEILEWRVVTHNDEVVYDETLPVMK
ncbi:hypothetical protein [Butyrivibrio sp. INlla16]|uniref:hypothetical protein n=1 Tax=Butyrivibrio sp. INlla16 TaxID=1520807 RepID=UPI00088172A2|nr:hypothetical protein [Butyrivibrio sp. INlla16]SDB29356.1 hypothetical protein SAMN02910263_01434 [Butyrivibrio sp. INlla16]